jgi:pimeloyl-ACP methyl ester carboxylesterase
MLFAAFSLALSLASAAGGVSLTTDDGARIYARTQVAPGAKRGVVMVHMLGRTSQDWASLMDRLGNSGVTSIAVDLRGHGQSSQAGQELVDTDYLAMGAELRAAATWLRGQGATEISCAGASIGANLCTQFAARDATIVNLALLSPGLNYKGIRSGNALIAYGDRPVLIVASEDDRFAFRASGYLEEAAKGQVHFEAYAEAGHGTRMLTRAPSLEGTMLSWLIGSFKLITGEIVRPQAAVKHNNAPLQTDGKKLQVHQ